jgi:mono/diheme cytochrome c family protein
MKKFGKVLLYAVILIIVIIIGVISYVTLALPDVGKAEDISIAATPQRLARGKYLVDHVTICTDCHSKRDWSKFAAPAIENSLGGGGELFDNSVGFPGSVHVPNITPYNLKNWSDGEIFRAITTGVRKNGNAIFPLMPWPYYSQLDREDVYSIITYIRTLQPISTSYPKSTLDFPLNILVHTMPQKAALSKIPSPADTVKYGEYMARSCACIECHTKEDKGKQLPGMQFAGGREFAIDGNIVRTANITPDMTTGIGTWSEAAFLARFRIFTDPSKAIPVKKSDFQTIMPWYAFSGMTDTDIKSIYRFLRTVKPVNNKVTKFQVNGVALASTK